ncbi:proline hydroxylase [Pedobacter yonginense]|uniref:Proline hydroxylase n=1 Tax=Pedobacter yonginense TaxID=651869 RepID=A0A317EQI7_9SPHI|nr:2OG-Fe(II) oxygenase [Pedobacter yonginense]PWS28635.1 proline hydroxylase [Pedobacter yonginense]
MEKIFDVLIDSFVEHEVGIANHFLSVSLAAHLKENLVHLIRQEELLPAKIGNNETSHEDNQIRSDVIYWLDRKHENQYENEFLDVMDRFVVYLNSTCYTGITGYEFHYTLYEKGAYYKKHIDQFQSNGSRKFSMVMYLNENWMATDGGELCIHHENTQQHISPENRKGVFFKSDELEHEVLMTSVPRMSITGWLKIN